MPSRLSVGSSARPFRMITSLGTSSVVPAPSLCRSWRKRILSVFSSVRRCHLLRLRFDHLTSKATDRPWPDTTMSRSGLPIRQTKLVVKVQLSSSADRSDSVTWTSKSRPAWRAEEPAITVIVCQPYVPNQPARMRSAHPVGNQAGLSGTVVNSAPITAMVIGKAIDPNRKPIGSERHASRESALGRWRTGCFGFRGPRSGRVWGVDFCLRHRSKLQSQRRSLLRLAMVHESHLNHRC